jgi:RNA recognition motif-containing protein
VLKRKRFMAKKLYIGNLAYATNNESLEKAFSQAGSVIEAVVMMDKMTGRSRGFGFVTMEDADAPKAIEMWDGKDLDGRRVKVNEARPREDRPMSR